MTDPAHEMREYERAQERLWGDPYRKRKSAHVKHCDTCGRYYSGYGGHGRKMCKCEEER